MDTLTQDSTEFDLILVPAWDEELGCELEHKITVCSVEVTHRLLTCNGGFNICATGAGTKLAEIADPVLTHDTCHKPLAECWVVNPI